MLHSAEFGILSLTACNSQTIQDYGKVICNELKRVKELKVKSQVSPWIVNTAPPGYTTANKIDSLSNLKNVV